MNLLLEENASLDNVPEELSTLMTVLQTLRTGTSTYIPGTYRPAAKYWKRKFIAPVDYTDKWYFSGKRNAWIFKKVRSSKLGVVTILENWGQRSCIMFFSKMNVFWQKLSSKSIQVKYKWVKDVLLCRQHICKCITSNI